MPAGRARYTVCATAVLLQLLSVLLCGRFANGMIADETINIDSSEQFTAIWSFEYAAGGELDMSITVTDWDSSVTNTSLQILYCTDSQISNLRDAHIDQICLSKIFDYTPCLAQFVLGAPPNALQSVTFNWTAASTDWYRILQLNCDGNSFTVDLNYVAVNPGGEYLSLSDVPFKTLYVGAIIGWSALFAIWCHNWFRYRYFNVKLQRVMTLVPLSKAFFSVLLLYYWRVCSRTGRSPGGLFWSSLVFVTLARGLYFGILMLIGRGWSITRAELPDPGRVVSLAVCLMIAHGLYSYYSGFVLFLLVIMYVFVLRFIFSSVQENSSALMNQLELIRRLDIDHTTTPVWTKLQMFKRFQVALVVFVSVDVIFHLWATIFLRDTPWVEDMMEHVLTGVMAIGVGYTFRLQPFNPYFYRVGERTVPNGGAAAAAANRAGAALAAARNNNSSNGTSAAAPLASASDGASAMLLAAHAAATASANAGRSAANDSSVDQPLIAGGASSSDDASPTGNSGGGRAGERAGKPVSGLIRWEPGMPLPAMPTPDSWMVAGGDTTELLLNPNSGAGAGAAAAPSVGGVRLGTGSTSPIVVIQNPFPNRDSHDVVLASRSTSTYEAPRLVFHPVTRAANVIPASSHGTIAASPTLIPRSPPPHVDGTVVSNMPELNALPPIDLPLAARNGDGNGSSAGASVDRKDEV